MKLAKAGTKLGGLNLKIKRLGEVEIGNWKLEIGNSISNF